jgi:hypothetical protein
VFADPLTQRLVDFVTGIGIEVRPGALADDAFLPGLAVCEGALVIDESRLAHPGDILHEAAHIAVTDPAERHDPALAPSQAEEFACLAWSYAAAVHLAIDPAVVFHAEGYGGAGARLAQNFGFGHFIGLPLLQQCGMTIAPRDAAERGLAPYPHMLRWLR